MHKRGAHGEVFAKAIVGIEAHHRFALHVHESLILEGDINASTAIQDRFVDDGDGPHGVVDGIIYILRKKGSTGCNPHRTGRYVGNTTAQTDLPRGGCFVLASQNELIAFGGLPCHHGGIVVDFLVHILIGNSIIAQPLP